MKMLVALTLLAAGAALGGTLTVANVTATSATLHWTADAGDTTYDIWRLQTGSYGQIMMPYVTNHSGTKLDITRSAGFPWLDTYQVRGTQASNTLSVAFLSPPSVSYATCAKPYGLARLPYTQFYPGIQYKCTFIVAGNPTPVMTLQQGLPGMILTGNTVTWIGYVGGSVTLRLVNSQARVDFTYTLTAK